MSSPAKQVRSANVWKLCSHRVAGHAPVMTPSAMKAAIMLFCVCSAFVLVHSIHGY